ncbi:hypothetical protein EZH22_26900 [Xanthobacter dioxanivorans]|uniref:Glycosyltransferase n=1 Tax=Xanthobacter dioxanivorans TaxID=2528964 RepID=A0A974SIJ9_9HYPH|nr:hypothetical protein [Xanthobacter dioxanivorans]QRG06517.1 hypothetical protein EZH22_26900 [Xanthobacter dioxanivorans]
MRDLSHYTFTEWLAAAPLAHRLRRARNRLVDRVYGQRPAAGQEALVERLRGAPVLAFTVAFNMPDAVALLADAMGRFLPGTPLVVCDNSTDDAARTDIARLCAGRDLPYCPLPPSPYRGKRNGSRSHAVALNWIVANLVRPAAPGVIALIDHDLIPLGPEDFVQRVAGQPCYGLVRHGTGNEAWYLWPGYSVFDFGRVAGTPLDFGTDTPLTLDTGGQNWDVLYRTLDLPRLRMASRRRVYLADVETGESEHFMLTDNWLHVGGAGHRGGGAGALARVRRAYDADPDGLLASLLASGPP